MCWLTGSLRALYSLYAQGEHPNYFGKYLDLNNKKYLPLQYLAMRDRNSVKELFESQGRSITDQQADRLYEKHGGAIGDLLQQGL